ncbi:N(2)-fixation sustaining protein CowN [Beijerinckia indica]|uniref:N(2)-fixation sustaining protein CowN n=1 Tax=Beijerinckia indica subsp. indica (strain ATCC 9039 / DSM 1715 / NCIMB 8712) TaxID=395963 RepID=COWN_BEII9|nr:N(2)-fixation sustaining protein CowN [Beijerinckia indica]B2IFA4.1 RecName: Full=N(2)-fixation sustaining protein CowN; AltName: Full=CO weal-nitrogenase [Beijerinckia indica subsp. indica ATCC 9039]ACB95669.1 conserved hypothetical protein [Beijerinckia indica subsp. indica ATCC 9039]
MTAQVDRYVSFKGIDWVGRSREIFARLQSHIDQANSPFWPYFTRQRKLAHSQGLDDLRVLHNYLPTLRELLENMGDLKTLGMLEELEQICM